PRGGHPASTGAVDVKSDVHHTSAFAARATPTKHGPARNLSWKRRPRREAFFFGWAYSASSPYRGGGCKKRHPPYVCIRREGDSHKKWPGAQSLLEAAPSPRSFLLKLGLFSPQRRTGVVDVKSDIHPTSAFVARATSTKNGPARTLAWRRRPRREAFFFGWAYSASSPYRGGGCRKRHLPYVCIRREGDSHKKCPARAI